MNITTNELDSGAFTGTAWRIMEQEPGALREADAPLLSLKQAAVLGYLEIAATRGAISEFPVEVPDAHLNRMLAHAWDCGALAWSGDCHTAMCWPEAPADVDEWIAVVLDQCPPFQAALDGLLTRPINTVAAAITEAKGDGHIARD